MKDTKCEYSCWFLHFTFIFLLLHIFMSKRMTESLNGNDCGVHWKHKTWQMYESLFRKKKLILRSLHFSHNSSEFYIPFLYYDSWNLNKRRRNLLSYFMEYSGRQKYCAIFLEFILSSSKTTKDRFYLKGA